MLILLKLHRCFVHGLKTCMWFGYNPQIRFCHFFRNLNLVFFRHYYYQHNYVDSIYLVRVTAPINFTFSDDSAFFKKNLGEGHKFSEFACFHWKSKQHIMKKTYILAILGVF